MGTTERKRRWDSTESREEEGSPETKEEEGSTPETKEENTTKVIKEEDASMADKTVNGAAIKAALEVAKRLSAKLSEAHKDDGTASDGSSTESPTITTTNNESSSSSSDESDTEAATATIPPSPFKLAFPFEKESSTLFLDPSFPKLLHAKLQVGPAEHFSSLVIVSASTLELEASSQEILDLAEKECISIRDSGSFMSSAKTKAPAPEKILLGYEASLPPAHTSFLRGKLLGPQGSFLKHIHAVTNCRVQLRGKGSGHIEMSKSAGEAEALHLVVEGGARSGEEELREARQLCEDLIATAKTDYEAKFFKPAPAPQYSQYTPNSPAQYPQYSQYPHYSKYPQSQYPTQTTQYAQYPNSPIPTQSTPIQAQYAQYPNNTIPTQIPTQPDQSQTQAQTQAQAQAQAQYYQQYQQYQQALAQYYAQFTQNKQP